MLRNSILAIGASLLLSSAALPAFADDIQLAESAPAAAVAPAPVSVSPASLQTAQEPHGQAALQGVLDELLQGKAELMEIEPMARINLQQQPGMLPALSMRLQSFGGLQSATYAGKQNGMEIYDVRFASATMIWGVVVDRDGKIAHIRWKFR